MICNLQKDSNYFDFPELQCYSGRTLTEEKYPITLILDFRCKNYNHLTKCTIKLGNL